jgi:hypothetical protein
MLRCSGNRNLVYTNEHKINPCSVQAKVSIQQQFLQGVSCNKLSFFRISDKINMMLTYQVFSPTTGSLEFDS